MVSRADRIFISLLAAAVITGVILDAANSYYATIVVLAVVFASYLYSAYWALGIRSALKVRLYRNQALGLGLIAVSFFPPFILVYVFNFTPYYGFISLFYLVFLFIFFWVDTSMRAARRSDPLLRNTFHWTQLRVLLWSVDVVVPVMVFFGTFLFYVSFFEPAGRALGEIAPLILISPFLVTLFSGAVILPLAARRSSDTTLRNHLKWFGLFSVSIFFALLLGFQLNGTAQELVLPTSFLAGGYCLYRSARSLVLLNRVSVGE